VKPVNEFQNISGQVVVMDISGRRLRRLPRDDPANNLDIAFAQAAFADRLPLRITGDLKFHQRATDILPTQAAFPGNICGREQPALCCFTVRGAAFAGFADRVLDSLMR
jgi:hypothetical protein